MVQSKGINFEGQNIFIGIDVHLKNWNVTVLTASGYGKKHSQKSSAKELFEHLKKHYPNGNYQAVYESGFSGFSTYYALKEYGINCMVIHAADVPTTQYESVMKSDSIDSETLAKSLKAGTLKGIYIPKKEYLDNRNLMRFRNTLQRQFCGYKSRVKHLLYNNGVQYPDCFAQLGTHWSRRKIFRPNTQSCVLITLADASGQKMFCPYDWANANVWILPLSFKNRILKPLY